MTTDISTVGSLIEKAQDVLVFLPQNPGPDSIAAALSLGIALERAGKDALVACSTPIDFTEYPLRLSEKITQKIGNKNLVISLQVANRDSIDKVSYNLDEATKTFNLIVTPKKGAQPLSSDAVSYSLSGAKADLIFIVGGTSFESIGSLYAAEPAVFAETPTIAINRLDINPYATHHLSSPTMSSVSEFMASLIKTFKLPLDQDSATNLMAAIDVVTDKLQLPATPAGTYEAVAELIRAGATRVMLVPPVKTHAAQEVPSTPVEVDTIEPESVMPEEIPEDWLSPKILKAPKNS
jgi:hypothetical protein